MSYIKIRIETMTGFKESYEGLIMRTSRMIEMIYLLLDNRQQKAQVLADHFNVSTKTIYRDVETLSKAGIPIKMQQGVSGGIILDERYMTNQKKLSEREEKGLASAVENIKKLPNAQLEYALKMLKQYFNEAGTLWVNTDDVSLDLQDKFHIVKVAIIEKCLLEFDYFENGVFNKYTSEPYELRLKNNLWTLVTYNTLIEQFEELYLSRMIEIEVKEVAFKRRSLPEEYGKRYSGQVCEVEFKILKLSERLLNTFPVECIDFERMVLRMNVKDENQNIEMISNLFSELERL